MWRRHWLRNPMRPGRPAARPALRPTIESLDQRWLLSTLTVTQALDGRTGSLRAEIAAAQNGDSIVFAPGLAAQTITLTKGELLVNKNLTIAGPGASALTISGDNASRVFDVASGAQVALSGLIISNGVAVNGGGILNNGTLTITECTVSGNSATQVSKRTRISNEGGAIDNFGTLSVLRCTVSDNSSVLGGGICNDNGTLTVSGSTLERNTGSAIYNGLGQATVTGSTVTQNTAFTGAGMVNYGTMSISGCSVSDNTANGGASYGGAIFTQGTLTISDGSTLAGNRAGEFGGAIYAGNGAVSITDSMLTGNSADYGGAVFIQNSHTQLSITGSALSSNTAVLRGGAIDVYSGTLALNGSTLTDNTAGDKGGAIYTYVGTLTVGGSTLTGNSAATAGGGIFIDTSPLQSATATLTSSSSITNNIAPLGFGADVDNLGVLYADSTVDTTDMTVAGNPANPI